MFYSSPEVFVCMSLIVVKMLTISPYFWFHRIGSPVGRPLSNCRHIYIFIRNECRELYRKREIKENNFFMQTLHDFPLMVSKVLK